MLNAGTMRTAHDWLEWYYSSVSTSLQSFVEEIQRDAHREDEYREDLEDNETLLNRILRSLETHSKHINERLNKMASAIQDFAAKVQANFDKTTADLDGISTEISDLNAKIVALQNSPGTISAEDQAALDAIVAASARVTSKADALVLPPVPPVPATP